MAREPHTALFIVSCTSYIHIKVYVSYICLLHLSSITCCHVRGKDGDDANVKERTEVRGVGCIIHPLLFAETVGKSLGLSVIIWLIGNPLTNW